MSSALVETDWLADRLGSGEVRVVDASWHLPNAGRDGYSEFLGKRIPGSIFFDVDALSDTTSPLPHMLPSADEFAQAISALGISSDDRIVVYDSHGLFSAARVWWTFHVMGHESVAILNGGLPKWMAENRPVENGKADDPEPGSFSAQLDAGRVRDMAQVRTALASSDAQVLDARPKPRFDGTAPEPRPELKSGHMPDSLNLHYSALIGDDGTLKPASDLADLFDGAGVDRTQPIITTCGSGVTAAILTLSLHELGCHDTSLFDGSWTQWAGDPDSVIETVGG